LYAVAFITACCILGLLLTVPVTCSIEFPPRLLSATCPLFGAAPDLKWFRIWGCTLKPVAARRKDFNNKAYSGFLVGYAQQKHWLYDFYALDKIIIFSVHVVFNEVILNPTADYFSELRARAADDRGSF
jgi:hypothetical protein